MPKRILDYEVEIVESTLNNGRYLQRGEEMPIIVPIVIYTGKVKWNATGYIQKCREILNELESFRLGNYYIIDVNNYTKEDLIKEDLLISKLMLLEKIENAQELYEVYKKIIRNEKDKSNVKLLLIILRYIYKGKLGEKYTKDLEKDLTVKLEEGGNENMIEETISRLIQKENRELINKGRKESLIDVAKRMLKENMDIDFITKITGLRKEQFMK